MKRFMQSLLLAVALAFSTGPAQAALRIVATIPDLADITRRIGGEYVKVESLATGTEDIHAVPQRPSFVPKLNQADGVVLLGLEAEHTFLPALLEVAQNPNILRGRNGYIDCSQKITPLEIPTDLSRAQGELHAQGNPHYNADPRQGFAIATTIEEGLSRLDPAHSANYKTNREAFDRELQTKIKEWGELSKAVKGKKAISYHPDVEYLAQFLGLDLVGTVEMKPGIPPTPKHLEELVSLIKEQKVPLIFHEIQYPRKTADWIAAQTGAKVVDIATMGGAFPDSKTYFGMLDHNIRAVVEGLK